MFQCLLHFARKDGELLQEGDLQRGCSAVLYGLGGDGQGAEGVEARGDDQDADGVESSC